jgi:hypothetical protein
LLGFKVFGSDSRSVSVLFFPVRICGAPWCRLLAYGCPTHVCWEVISKFLKPFSVDFLRFCSTENHLHLIVESELRVELTVFYRRVFMI